MKYIFIIASLFMLCLAKAQSIDPRGHDPVWWRDSVDRSEAHPVGTSSSASVSSGRHIANPAIPPVGPHYDDPPEPHYEMPGVINDGRPSMEQGVVIPYSYLREADVKFKKRIWRRIDTRQKLNKSFTWPGQPITKVLYELAINGKVKAYANDSFASWKTPDQARAIGGEELTTLIPNPNDTTANDDYIEATFWVDFDWMKIQKLEIVEDWIFDYKLSEFFPRIIGVAPIMTKSFGTLSVDVPMFWMKMEDLRPTLAKSEVFNRYNDAMRISWDDLFNHFRIFDSYIVKETSYNNMYINQNAEFQQDGLAALLEGERIKNDLFIFEHDLWEF